MESTLLAGGKSKKKDGNLGDSARGQADSGSAAVYTMDRPGTGLKPNERSTKRRDFGTSPSITPSCTTHESLEMPPNAAARCSDTSSS